MRNEINSFFLISLLIHAALMLFFGIKFSRPVFLNVPVEVRFYSPPAAAGETEQEKQKELVRLKKARQTASLKAPVKAKEKKLLVKKEPVPSGTAEEAKKTESLSQPAESQVAQGSNITLDTANFPYTYYTNQIVKKIAANWKWANKFGKLKALVYFRIQRGGGITDLEVKKPSGDTVFDQQAGRAIELSSPFPPLPAAYAEDSLGIYFEFSYTE